MEKRIYKEIARKVVLNKNDEETLYGLSIITARLLPGYDTMKGGTLCEIVAIEPFVRELPGVVYGEGTAVFRRLPDGVWLRV